MVAFQQNQPQKLPINNWLRLATYVPKVKTLGPGNRIAIWLQGCSRHCPGCISPELQNKNSGQIVRVESLFSKISEIAPDHSGITISGGEPFEQADALLKLITLVRERTKLDIMVYTGFKLEELQKCGCNISPALPALLKQIDILIDGSFILDQPTEKIWRGSENQELHLLSKRVACFAYSVNQEYGDKRELQVGYTCDGALHIIGIPARGDLKKLKDALKEKGIRI